MELDYIDLLSPEPVFLPRVGRLTPPTLREISRLTWPVYETYLAFLSMPPSRYCTEVKPELRSWYESLPAEQAQLLSMYDIIVSSQELADLFCSIFHFFFAEEVIYNKEKDAFLLFTSSLPSSDTDTNSCSKSEMTGMITKSCYDQICSLILQMNHIQTDSAIDPAKIKNEKGRKIYERIQKFKAKQSHTTKKNNDLEIGNIISAVCTRHHSINYTNVWDMTIYQLWDTFHRLQADNAYEIGRTAVSVWGDKEKKFDFNSWFKNIR